MTRTYTQFFGDDQLGDLRVAIDELADDWAKRAPHIDTETRTRGQQRIDALLLAAARMADPA